MACKSSIWQQAALLTFAAPAVCLGAAGARPVSFFDTAKVESWGAWMAGVLLVAVVAGARHAVRPVRHPSFFVLLRALAAVTMGLPFLGVVHGLWSFAASRTSEAIYCGDARVNVVYYMALCGAFLMVSAFWRPSAFAAGLVAALGAVECAHVAYALGLPPGEVWGQSLGAGGFLLTVAVCVLIVILPTAHAPLGSTRDRWAKRLQQRSLALALALSLVPGLGIYYVSPGRRSRSQWLVAFLCATAAAFVIFVPFWDRVLFYNDPRSHAGWPLFLAAYCLLFATGVALTVVLFTRRQHFS